MLKSFEKFMSLLDRKNSRINAPKSHDCRLEALEERALLSAVPLSAAEYSDLRAQYADFNLPENMDDLNVITLDLAEGDDLAALKSAITEAGETTQSDLIVVRTSTDASSLTYTALTDELTININARQYGSVSIIGLGDSNFTLDANQMCRVMTVSGSSTIANLGGLTITGGKSIASQSNSSYGGGIYNNSATLKVTNSTFSGNTASRDGGGIYNDGELTVTNSEISGNTARFGGGIYNYDGTLTVTNSTISGNTADEDGGIYNYYGMLTVTNSTISGNTASLGGGGIYNYSGTLTVTNSEISGNTADDGGGIYNYDGTLTVTNSTISENTAEYFGGGIGTSSGELTVTNSTISGNTAGFRGGGIYNGSDLTVTNCTISENTAEHGGGIDNALWLTVTNSEISGNTAEYGGGIENYYGVLTVTNSEISGNTAEYGGGIYNGSGTLTVTNSTISGNTASSSGGGGIYNDGTLTVTNSTISGNTASRDGGGIINHSGTLTITNSRIAENTASSGGGIYNHGGSDTATITVTNSTISGNTASSFYGGGIYNSFGILTVTNSTISGNTASYSGGGIYNWRGTFTVTNSTISGNTASDDGGGIYNYRMTKVYNSIVACNAANNGEDVYNRSEINGYNCLSSYTEWYGGGNIEYDPESPLFRSVENGDYRLAPGSQAIDMGNNQYAYDADMDETWTDMSGKPRFMGGSIDLGAYEFFGIETSQQGIYVGDVIFSWNQYENTANVLLTWVSGTNKTVLGTFGSVGEYTWDTTAFADGYGQLTVEYLDGNGKAILSSTITGLILNDENVVVHRGEITGSETWSADKVHLVARRIDLKNANLTIENSAVVKFWKNSYLNTNSGSTLTLQDNVIFTRAEDDEVAGDTNLDGDLSTPQFGNAYIRGTGTFNVAESVDMKYVTTTKSGTISFNETWLSGQVYRVTGDVTIANGATLTIQPGAIVKFDSGKSLIVQSGGTLNAQGTVAQPIVFTSVKDDQYGGDTNEDDGEYEPAGGDWDCISVNGTAILKNAILQYGAPYNESGIIEVCSNGSVQIDSCRIANAKYDGLWNWGGSFEVVNTVITNVGLCTAPYCGTQTFTNCTFDGSNYLAMYWGHWTGTGTYKNCIFNNMGSGWIDTQGSNAWQSKLTFLNCDFYSTVSTTNKSFAAVGSNGNIWADPKFRNAAAGDYYLMAGSPCIDAGTSNGAPETDITGAPRVKDPYTDRDGVVDIGAYEFVDGVSSSIDLEPVNVQAPASATTGDSVTIQWTIRNNGSTAAVGTWTDEVYLISDHGQKVLVKDVTHSANIAAGDLQTFYADVDLPAIGEGTWKFAVHVNPNREIFEGISADNNLTQATGTTEIGVPTLTETEKSAVVTREKPMLYKVSVAAGQAFCLKTTSSQPISVRMSEKGVPGSDSSAEHLGVQYGDNQNILSIPAADVERTFYLLVSSEKEAGVNLSISETAFDLLATSISEVSNKGTSTISCYGAGFDSSMTITLKCGTKVIDGTNITVSSASQATARFDLTGVAAGMYDLILTQNGQTKTLENAVKVNSNGVGAVLDAHLEIPQSIRSGRVYKGVVVYQNTGDCDLLIPVFTISGNDPVGLTSDRMDSNSVQILGIGTQEAGILAPGESGKAVFYFVAGSNTHISMGSWVDDETAKPMFDSEYWTTWAEFHSDLSEAVNQLAARGIRALDYDSTVEFLLAQKADEPSTGLSGYLYHTGSQSPLANCEIQASWVVNAGTEDEEIHYDYATTDAEGFYVFNFLPVGTEITLELTSGAYDLSQTILTLAENNDVTGFQLTALPFGGVTGRIINQNGSVVSNTTVILTDAYGEKLFSITDRLGVYSFDQLQHGTYTLSVETYNEYKSVEDIEITISDGTIQTGKNIRLDVGSVVTGTISDENETGIYDAIITLTDSKGKAFTSRSDENGHYTISGLEAGSFSVEIYAYAYTSVSIPNIEVADNESFVLDQTMVEDEESCFITEVFRNTLGEAVTPEDDLVLTISGFWGDSVDHITLTDEAGHEFTSTKVESLVDYLTINAYFSSAEVGAGSYRVKLTTDSLLTATYAVPFERTNEVNTSSWQYSISGGDTIAANGYGVYTFIYSNTGDTALPAPLVYLTAEQLGGEGAFLTLDYNEYQSVINSEFDNLSDILSSSVAFVADGDNAGLIMPGETKTIEVYCVAAFTGYDNNILPVHLSTDVKWFNSDSQIDWGRDFLALESEDELLDYSDYITFLNEYVGNTWGDYVTEMDSVASMYDTYINYRMDYLELQDAFYYYTRDMWDEILEEQENSNALPAPLEIALTPFVQSAMSAAMESQTKAKEYKYTPGTVVIWKNGQWEIATEDNFDKNQETFILVHGFRDGIEGYSWIEMARTLKSVKKDANILGIDWEEDADSLVINPFGPASNIPYVAKVAYLNLLDLDLDFTTTSIIGHSHGAHVSGLIGYWSGGTLRQITALDASEEFAHIMSTNFHGQSWGIKSAQYVVFYKSSRNFGGETAWGDDNFIVVKDGELYGTVMRTFADHSFAVEWYTESIKQANSPGFNWTYETWDTLTEDFQFQNKNGRWNGIIVTSADASSWHIEGLNIPEDNISDTYTDYKDEEHIYNMSLWKYPGEWNTSSNSSGSMNNLLKSIKKSVEFTYSVSDVAKTIKTGQR